VVEIKSHRDLVSLAGEVMWAPDCVGTMQAHGSVCPTDQAFTCSQVSPGPLSGVCRLLWGWPIWAIPALPTPSCNA